MSEPVMCYVGRHRYAPGYFFASVDDHDAAKDNAKEIARIIKAGDIVERVTVEQAKAGMQEYFAWKKNK